MKRMTDLSRRRFLRTSGVTAVGLGVGGGLAAGGFVDLGPGGALAFIAAFTLGALAWAVGVSALLGFARRWATPRLFRVVDLVCGAAFGFFGVRLLLESISVLRG